MTARTLIIAGTDTGAGKTVFAAALAGALDACYWKPVQAGIEDGGTDAERVARLAGLPCEQVLPETYRSEEHTSELQSLMRISYAVFCLKKKKKKQTTEQNTESI